MNNGAGRRRYRGFTLVEVMIAGVLLAILVAGALASMKTTTGFTARAGRMTQATARALEWGEFNRNLVQPGWTAPSSLPAPGSVPMMGWTAGRTMDGRNDPCTSAWMACPGGPNPSFVQQMNATGATVSWNEPKN